MIEMELKYQVHQNSYEMFALSLSHTSHRRVRVMLSKWNLLSMPELVCNTLHLVHSMYKRHGERYSRDGRLNPIKPNKMNICINDSDSERADGNFKIHLNRLEAHVQLFDI